MSRIWLCPSAFAPHVGGVEELTAQLGHELVRRGHDVHIVTNRWPLELPAEGEHDGLPVHRLAFVFPARRPVSWLRYLQGTPGVNRSLAGLPRPDMIHIQCASSQLPALRRYSKERRVPIVLSTQGETEMDSNRIYQRNPWLRQELRRSSRAAAALTACSEWTREAASTIAPAFRAADVILNGVTPGQFTVGPRPEAPIFGAYGRLVHQKGFDVLLEAFRLVRLTLPQAQLLLGGDGPEMPFLVRSAGLGVTFLGRLDRDGVRDLLERSRVIVVPSRVEPFGIVAVEALAADRGLVYSSVGGPG